MRLVILPKDIQFTIMYNQKALNHHISEAKASSFWHISAYFRHEICRIKVAKRQPVDTRFGRKNIVDINLKYS